MPAAQPAVAEVQVGDAPSVWEALGFTLRDGVARVGSVAIRPVGAAAGRGIVGWTLRDAVSVDLDGLPTTSTTAPAAPADGHANGVVAVDHVVVRTPDRARTSALLQAAGLGLRRIRPDAGTPERPLVQAFHRAGPVIVEIVGPPTPPRDGGHAPARFWGLACLVDDLDVAAAFLGDRLGTPKDAVQPGRRIATVRREAGSSVPLALLSR